MTFELKIELGNEAMQTRGDVGRALAVIAERLIDGSGAFTHHVGLEFAIRDENGNRVGEWRVA